MAARYQLTLEATYSTDVKNSGTKYYHDGNDWVGRSSSGIFRAANRWDISGIDPSWDIVSVEVRFYVEAKPDLPGHFPSTAMAHPMVRTTPRLIPVRWYTARSPEVPMHPYLSLPQGPGPSWVNLGSTAASDIAWCRDGGLSTWSLGLKASDAIEASTTVRPC